MKRSLSQMSVGELQNVLVHYEERADFIRWLIQKKSLVAGGQ